MSEFNASLLLVGRICDPACGSSSLLIKIAKEIGDSNFSLYGQESNRITWALCKMNMFLHGMDNARIEWGEKQNTAKRGDIFFTVSSETPEEVGMSSVLLDKVDEVYLNSFCFGYRLNDFSKLLPDYARFLFRGYDFRREIYRLAQGFTRYNLSKKEVMKIRIKLPSVKEQIRVASLMSTIETEINFLTKEFVFLHREKKGLMQKLLTGEILVKI